MPDNLEPKDPAVQNALEAPSPGGVAPKANPATALNPPDTTADTERAKLGALVVCAGLAAVLIAFVIAVLHYGKAADVATGMGTITGVIGTLVGAYFGVQVGSHGKAASEAARTQADNQAKALASVAPTEAAAKVLGVPTPAASRPDQDPGATPGGTVPA